MIGQTVSHYRILEKLGGGGMGIVYKAEDTKLKRTVALKFLLQELTRDESSKSRFIHEARAASALQHNNICTIHEIDETPDGQLFISMDCYEGKSLKKRIERGPLPVTEAIDITKKIASGLAKAHEAGMVHRDIKPANVMLTGDGEVKIVDFGLAKLAGMTKVTKTGTTVGTVAYMSPEQAGGHEVDGRSDIFSLGAVLYELLTGKLPFTGDHEAAVLYGIMHSEPAALNEHRKDLPEQVQRIIDRMLKKDAGNRYANASDLFHDLTVLRSEVESRLGTPPNRGGGRMLWMSLAAAAVVVIVGVVLIFGRGRPAPDEIATDIAATENAELAAPTIDRKSIAVMAFADMSPGKDQEYFSDGMSEELMNLLAKIPELKVISRSSTFSYKGKSIPLKQIAEELGVTHILEGSVRKDGNRVRITAQLIEADTDTHVWSETYNRTFDDIFAIQDEIAAAVIKELKIALLSETPHVRRTDPEAWMLFKRAWNTAALGTAEAYEEAVTLTKKALTIDPEWAGAWVGLSKFYYNQSLHGLRPREEAFALVNDALDKALAIDPNLAGAHAGKGGMVLAQEGDLAAAARHYTRALELSPNDQGVITNLPLFLHMLGRPEACIEIWERGAANAPLLPRAHANLAEAYLSGGRWDKAIASARTAMRLSPGHWAVHYYVGVALLMKGEPQAALEEFAQEVDEELGVKGTTLALYALGRHEEFETKLQEMIERWGDQWPSEIAQVYAFTGDRDQAFRWLDKSIAEKEEGGFDPLDPLLNSLRDDPRWLPLLERIGRSPQQLEAIDFEVTLPPSF